MKQQDDFLIQPDRPVPWDQTRYQTGKTTPPEKKQSFLPVILVLFLFFGSLISTLSLLNIRMFRQLPSSQERGEAHIAFAHSEESFALAETFDQLLIARNTPEHTPLGVAVEDLSEIDRHYYRLPQGVWISSVDSRSDAAHKGIRQGDLLISIDNTLIFSQDALSQLLNNYQSEDVVNVVVHRNNTNYNLWLSLNRED